MTKKNRFILLIALSLLTGWLLFWIDSRPGWDDSGITAGLMVLLAAFYGFISPEKPWIWGLTTGLWIPLMALFREGSFSLMPVCLFAFAGAYLGASVRRNKPADPQE
ncbi:MAG: hypothetical protein LWW85_01420 [Marinilabiliales bacterium]|nr:hypothetical protein [Marinilabiliales bacterium]